MIVRILVEYEVLGDDEYSYVERFDREYNDTVIPESAEIYTRHYIVNTLAKRGIVIKKIKELRVGYED
jgi:hypothetical protein